MAMLGLSQECKIGLIFKNQARVAAPPSLSLLFLDIRASVQANICLALCAAFRGFLAGRAATSGNHGDSQADSVAVSSGQRHPGGSWQAATGPGVCMSVGCRSH